MHQQLVDDRRRDTSERAAADVGGPDGVGAEATGERVAAKVGPGDGDVRAAVDGAATRRDSDQTHPDRVRVKLEVVE
eukprot:1644495-Prymnesium_polylepis.1